MKRLKGFPEAIILGLFGYAVTEVFLGIPLGETTWFVLTLGGLWAAVLTAHCALPDKTAYPRREPPPVSMVKFLHLIPAFAIAVFSGVIALLAIHSFHMDAALTTGGDSKFFRGVFYFCAGISCYLLVMVQLVLNKYTVQEGTYAIIGGLMFPPGTVYHYLWPYDGTPPAILQKEMSLFVGGVEVPLSEKKATIQSQVVIVLDQNHFVSVTQEKIRTAAEEWVRAFAKENVKTLHDLLSLTGREERQIRLPDVTLKWRCTGVGIYS